VALVGRFLLHEHVSPARWLGVTLIMAGVTLVGYTAPRTHTPHKRGISA
jgi:drug/metabolite transporter (DMT)-like permease